jgi:hypothetical protein
MSKHKKLPDAINPQGLSDLFWKLYSLVGNERGIYVETCKF